MSVLIIFISGIANLLLQILSRNILFIYVFIVFTVGAITIDVYKTKIGKVLTALSVIAYISLLVTSIYYHLLFGTLVLDYLIIAAETVFALLLTVVSICHLKNEVPSPAGRRFAF